MLLSHIRDYSFQAYFVLCVNSIRSKTYAQCTTCTAGSGRVGRSKRDAIGSGAQTEHVAIVAILIINCKCVDAVISTAGQVGHAGGAEREGWNGYF